MPILCAVPSFGRQAVARGDSRSVCLRKNLFPNGTMMYPYQTQPCPRLSCKCCVLLLTGAAATVVARGIRARAEEGAVAHKTTRTNATQPRGVCEHRRREPARGAGPLTRVTTAVSVPDLYCSSHAYPGAQVEKVDQNAPHDVKKIGH